MVELVTLDEVEMAAERVAEVTKRTPVDGSRTLAELSGAESVHLKLETLQRTGSFKIRGAYNTIAQLSPADRDRGVLAASGGNHAQGVAYAADALGTNATVVMPEVTPAAKLEATRGYGAEVVVHGSVYQESYERALELADERDVTFVHPFDDRAVIAGQGTLGLELIEAVPDVDTVLVAVGGGGLITGVATALKAKNESVRVVGVQTEGCSHMAESLADDEIHERDSIDTITEGIAASRTEAFTFEHVRERVDEVVTVTDGMVTEAMAVLAERSKLVTESAGAVAVAALFSPVVDVTDDTVAVPVCGANVDLVDFGRYVRDGLTRRGRYATVSLALTAWPEGLSTATETVEAAGGTVDDITPVTGSGVDPGDRAVDLSVSGSGPDHLGRVVDALGDREGVTVLDRPGNVE